MLFVVIVSNVGAVAGFCSVYLLKSAEAAVLGVGTAWSLTVTRSPVYFCVRAQAAPDMRRALAPTIALPVTGNCSLRRIHPLNANGARAGHGTLSA